jgi:hypothetical protein
MKDFVANAVNIFNPFIKFKDKVFSKWKFIYTVPF